jgi:hypothetical protein
LAEILARFNDLLTGFKHPYCSSMGID